ncbi:pyridoxal phosphate-dependent aminotransferase [Sulfitobacter sp. W074]|uniref:pyridoxal phosphate-dependent aminotransferase n=1 Tax=Sulfitobacter sp. W074 TaxID=2867026 RepID=UPI0021A5A781|nr:pyridoxal phosphate-dependent aminotransferase [Sulfitobacter sp. W074]UWR38432.1 pyridoxal phosphate-dependent aminotransferase [Sulfitobacter sp. W074]
MLDQNSAFRRSVRIAGIEISQIVQISEAAAQMRADGQDVVSLSTGAPDFPTPEFVVEAAHQAALSGQTGYTPTAGTNALRDAVANEYSVERGEVIISTGAKQVLANALLATLNAGDEVLIPTPYWTSYSDIVSMSGGAVVTIPCPMEQGFKLTPEALEAAITPKARWLMLNSPSNPSGAIYSADEIKALADVLEKHPHVWVLADEIYEHLSYAPFTSFTAAAPELANRTLVVSGVSKAWAMTGWRIGWGVGPKPLIAAMGAVQGQVTSGTCSIAQAAALAALSGERSVLAERLALFDRRRQLVVGALNAMTGITCPEPDGAFYVFPNIEGLMTLGGFTTCGEACDWILKEAQVAIVPGAAFGLPGHARISFAYSLEDLTEGLSRIADALSKLR